MSKRRSKKSPFTPANEEQTRAIESMVDFIRNGDPKVWYTLNGKAGTGKTTIVQEALAPFVRTKSVMIAALAHKAKLVLATKLEQRFGPFAVRSETIASALGMSMDVETGKFSVKASAKLDPPIRWADVIVVDEASMINEEALALIMRKKAKGAKVLFLGDIGQLPPIRKPEHPRHDAASPTFNSPHAGQLTQRVRQGEASPILPYADLFWNNSQAAQPSEDPVPGTERRSVMTMQGSLIFARSSTALSQTLPLYKVAVEQGRPDLVRCVVYRNNTRRILNDQVRQYVFGDRAEEQLVPGELLMFQDNFEQDQVKISNSTELQVRDVRRHRTPDGWQAWKIGFSFEGTPREALVLDRTEEARFKAHLDQLANRVKAMPRGDGRLQAWAKFYREKGRFAPVDYAYVITSHKAQGSTYDVVLVAEADIQTVALASAKAKSQSIYTAITRAKHLAIIMDGRHDEPDALRIAMDYAIEAAGIQVEVK